MEKPLLACLLWFLTTNLFIDPSLRSFPRLRVQRAPARVLVTCVSSSERVRPSLLVLSPMLVIQTGSQTQGRHQESWNYNLTWCSWIQIMTCTIKWPNQNLGAPHWWRAGCFWTRDPDVVGAPCAAEQNQEVIQVLDPGREKCHPLERQKNKTKQKNLEKI